MFAYCGNCPVSRIDQGGNSYKLCTMEMYDANLDYIYNQKDEPYASMPLGESTVGRDGCAIVATYNAMISLGNPRPFSEIYDFYSTRLVNNGNGGIFIASVARYFVNEGYQVRIFTSHTPSEVELCSQNADACIMLYRYKSSNRRYGHYVEYRSTKDGYLAKNINGGTDSFKSPILYGYVDNRYFMYGLYIYK